VAHPRRDVLGHHDLARSEDALRAVAALDLDASGEVDHELRSRCVVEVVLGRRVLPQPKGQPGDPDVVRAGPAVERLEGVLDVFDVGLTVGPGVEVGELQAVLADDHGRSLSPTCRYKAWIDHTTSRNGREPHPAGCRSPPWRRGGPGGGLTGRASDGDATQHGTSIPVAVGVREIRLTVNGSVHQLAVATDRLLVDLLRDDLGLTGTKLGCEIGVCGLCAVIVDGTVQSACLLPAVLTDGASIETVEGLAGPDGELSPIQRAFIRHGGFQCGICTPGQVVTATALLREEPHPTTDDIRTWMMGSLCRCTGYEGILEAIAAVAAEAGGTPVGADGAPT
jgi:carbon-monoxide dehydrogenase small subunit